MSVMTPDSLRQPQGRNLALQPQEPTRQAVIDQLAPTPPLTGAEPRPPTATTPGIFARGGQVKQLPKGDLAGTITRTAAGTATQMAGKMLGNTAAGAAAGAGINVGANMLADRVRKKEDMPTFGGANGQYLDQYGRRFEGTGGGTAAGAIRGAGYGANPALVAATGGLSVLGGAAIGAAIAAAKRKASSAFTDFRVEDAAEAIQNAYRNELGREANDDEVMGHLVNTGFDPTGGDRWSGEKGTNFILDEIRKSPEAEAFRNRGAVIDQLGGGAEPTASTVPAGAQRVDGQRVGGLEDGGAGFGGVGTPMRGGFIAPGGTLADTQRTAGAASMAAPGGGGGRLEGFDADKLASGHDSPKYQVARVLQKYPSTPEGLRQALPELQALGIGDVAIGGSKGDKLTFSGQTDPRFNGITTFDVIRAAGNGGEAWTWQPEGGAPEGGAATAGPAAAGTTELRGLVPEQAPDVMTPDALARIRAELERIIAGQPSRDALMEQLGT